MPKYRLTDDWHKAWQWASVRCMATALALQGAWEAIPDDLRAQAPHGMVTHATEALMLLGLLGRLVKKDVPVDCSELANHPVGRSCTPRKRKSSAGKPLAKSKQLIRSRSGNPHKGRS